jgi:hypothetical protein
MILIFYLNQPNANSYAKRNNVSSIKKLLLENFSVFNRWIFQIKDLDQFRVQNCNGNCNFTYFQQSK